MSAIRASSFLPLLPIAIPVASAGLLVALRPLLSSRRCTAAVALTAIASFAANCCCAKPPWTFALPAVPFEGSSSLLGQGLGFTLTPWTRLGGLLLSGTVALSALVRVEQPMSRSGAVFAVLMLAVGQSFILASNPLSLLICWAIMDLVLLGLSGLHALDLECTDRATRDVGLLQTAGICVLAAALLIRRDPRLILAGQVLMIVAAWIRMGGYPAQTRALLRKQVPLSEIIAARGIPLLAGLHLLIRVVEQGVPYLGIFVAISGAACLLTGFLAFQAPDFRSALSYIVLNQVSLALLILLTMGPTGAVAAWVTVANALLSVSCASQRDYSVASPLGRVRSALVLVATLSLIGLPLTGGFVSRWAILQGAVGRGSIGLVVVLSLSGALLVPPLMRWVFSPWTAATGGSSRIEPGEWVSFSATVLLFASIFGLRFLSPVLQGARGEGAAPPVIASAAPLLMILLGFAVPMACGALLARLSSRLSSVVESAASAAATVVDLDWAFAGLQLLGHSVRAPLRRVARFVEDETYLGWILLWALVIVLWLWRS